jgi:hypothetical protein
MTKSMTKKAAKKAAVREVVINNCYGGFGVSLVAAKALRKMGNEYAKKEVLAGEKWSDGTVYDGHFDSYCMGINRDDPMLVAVVRKLKEKANGHFAELTIVEIPADVEWEVEEYDGLEHVSERHRTWR